MLSKYLLYLTILLITLVQIHSVTSITHPRQKFHCLNICHELVTRCINLKTDKCLKSYHTCLSKAKDFYKCVNSSQIPHLKKLANCFEKKCD